MLSSETEALLDPNDNNKLLLRSVLGQEDRSKFARMSHTHMHLQYKGKCVPSSSNLPQLMSRKLAKSNYAWVVFTHLRLLTWSAKTKNCPFMIGPNPSSPTLPSPLKPYDICEEQGRSVGTNNNVKGFSSRQTNNHKVYNDLVSKLIGCLITQGSGQVYSKISRIIQVPRDFPW